MVCQITTKRMESKSNRQFVEKMKKNTKSCERNDQSIRRRWRFLRSSKSLENDWIREFLYEDVKILLN